MGRVVRFRRHGRRKSPWQKPPAPGGKGPIIAAVAAAVVLGGLVAHFATGGTVPAFLKHLNPIGVDVTSVVKPFGICGMAFGKDCVVDGDTIDYRGERVRMVDYDTPEISEPHCASEYALGQQAKFRLLELLNSGTVEVRRSGARDIDKYGRKLRLVLVNGRSVGDTLIAEGLAWPWEGHRHGWC
jgi:micrococcal nuclease